MILPSNLSPYPNRTVLWSNFESKFSKTTRRKFTLNILSFRVYLTLSESLLNFNNCRIVFENFDIENLLQYHMDTVRRRIRWKYISRQY